MPVNPAIKEALGEPSYPSLNAVQVPVDVVQVFRAREQVVPVAEEGTARSMYPSASDCAFGSARPRRKGGAGRTFAALANKDRLGIRAFWLQEGVIAPEAAALVSSKGKPGMGMVMNRCTYKECQRLMGPMATY